LEFRHIQKPTHKKASDSLRHSSARLFKSFSSLSLSFSSDNHLEISFYAAAWRKLKVLPALPQIKKTFTVRLKGNSQLRVVTRYANTTSLYQKSFEDILYGKYLNWVN
jgi:hypothetical protein